jgi:hypothetical protein
MVKNSAHVKQTKKLSSKYLQKYLPTRKHAAKRVNMEFKWKKVSADEAIFSRKKNLFAAELFGLLRSRLGFQTNCATFQATWRLIN